MSECGCSMAAHNAEQRATLRWLLAINAAMFIVELLLGMRYEDPGVRPLLDLEGLKAWLPGRTSGYALLERACARTHELDPFLRRVGAPA